MPLVVYGDFNCPYSRLASLRVDRLIERGTAELEWRAVQHDAEMPDGGVPVDDELRAELAREIDEIQGLLRPDEDLPYVIPEVRPNTARDCRLFAVARADAADAFRRRRFEEIWGGQAAIAGSTRGDQRMADEWQGEWEGIEDRMVPLLVRPTGLHRGVEGLVALGDLLDR